MITPAFSLTSTERVLPKLALDFTTASLDPRITFTRTTDATHPATYTNSNGYVTAATDNQPRFDYDPVTLTCKGLLIEESRSNLLTYSSDYTNAKWTNNNVVISSGSINSPDNTLTGFKIEDNNISGEHFFEQQTSTVSNQTYTQTVYVKAGTANQFQLMIVAIGSTFATSVAIFTQTSGVFNTSTFTGLITSTSITNVGNGWCRASVTYTLNGTVTIHRARFYPNTSGVYVGTGLYTYFWGAQLETGAFATSYIPTTTTALTRNADVATMTGTNFSSWWTATTGAVKTAVIPSTISGTRPLIQFDDNTATNQICLRGNLANPELYIKATTDQSQIDAGTIVANTAYKLSGAWNTNNCAAAQNGASPVTDSSATIPTVTQARIGSDGTNYANAWVQKISYWPQRLINAEVQAFSKI